MKHAGRKSVKEELPERRKGPKRATECRLKVPTHVWELEAASSNLATRTSVGTDFTPFRRLFMPAAKKTSSTPLHPFLLPKLNPLRWASILFEAELKAKTAIPCSYFQNRSRFVWLRFCFCVGMGAPAVQRGRPPRYGGRPGKGGNGGVRLCVWRRRVFRRGSPRACALSASS